MNADYNILIKKLEKWISNNPDSMQFARLADCLLSVGRIDEAVEHCLRGLQKYPRYTTGRFVLAKGYMAQGNNEDARREFETVLQMNNRYVLAWKYYGDLLRNMGQNEASDLSYAELVDIDPLDEDARAMVEALKHKREVENDAKTVREDTRESEPVELRAPMPEDEDQELNSEDKFSYILDDIFSEEEEGNEVEEETDDDLTPEISDITGVELPEQKELTKEEQPIEPLAKPKAESEETENLLTTEFDTPSKEEDEVQFTDQSEKPDANKRTKPKIEAKQQDEERIVTPTLGEIYAAQGQFAKAISVFEILAKKDPDNKSYQDKIAFLRQKLKESSK